MQADAGRTPSPEELRDELDRLRRELAAHGKDLAAANSGQVLLTQQMEALARQLAAATGAASSSPVEQTDAISEVSNDVQTAASPTAEDVDEMQGESTAKPRSARPAQVPVTWEELALGRRDPDTNRQQTTTAEAVATADRSAANRKAKAGTATRDAAELEQQIGTKVLTWLGAVAMLLAVGFTVHWAWSTFHVSPFWQIVGLHGLGIALLAGGAWARHTRLDLLAQGLFGLGIFSLYATTFAGLQLHELYSSTGAFAECAVITIAAIALALAVNSQGVIILGALGGYATPFLTATEAGDPVSLFLYLAFLNAALLGASLWRGWHGLKPLTLAATVLMFCLWLTNWYDYEQRWSATWLGLLHAGLFLAACMVPQLAWRRSSTSADLSTLAAASLGFLTLCWALFHDSPDQRLALVAWGLAAGYLGLFGAAVQRVGLEDRLARVLLALSAVFFTLALPLQLDDPAYLGLAWAVEGFVFTAVGVYFSDRQMRASGAVVYALAAARLLLFDYLLLDEQTFTALELRHGFLTILTGSLLTMGGGALEWFFPRRWPHRDSREVPFGRGLSGLLIAGGNVLLLAAFSRQYSGHLLTVIWTLDAALIWALGFALRLPAARAYAALVAVVFAGGSAMAGGFGAMDEHATLVNPRLGSLALLAGVYLVGGWATWRSATTDDVAQRSNPMREYSLVPQWEFREIERGLHVVLAVLGNGLLVLAGFLEVRDWFDTAAAAGRFRREYGDMAEQATLSALWTIHAALLVAIGFALRYRVYRLLGLAAFLPIVAKVFLVDLAELRWLPRVLALAVLGLMSLATSALYQRFSARLREA